MTRLVLIAAAALALLVGGVTRSEAATSAKLDVFLYVDSVNGTRPAGAKPRPIGCTQTNIFQRGEQLVFRVWGSEVSSGAVLSTENVKYAYAKIPGQPNLKLNWGAHGAAPNRVWFWTAAFQIPKDYPLGTATMRIVFKTEANKFGIFDYTVTINP